MSSYGWGCFFSQRVIMWEQESLKRWVASSVLACFVLAARSSTVIIRCRMTARVKCTLRIALGK